MMKLEDYEALARELEVLADRMHADQARLERIGGKLGFNDVTQAARRHLNDARKAVEVAARALESIVGGPS